MTIKAVFASVTPGVTTVPPIVLKVKVGPSPVGISPTTAGVTPIVGPVSPLPPPLLSANLNLSPITRDVALSYCIPGATIAVVRTPALTTPTHISRLHHKTRGATINKYTELNLYSSHQQGEVNAAPCTDLRNPDGTPCGRTECLPH